MNIQTLKNIITARSLPVLLAAGFACAAATGAPAAEDYQNSISFAVGTAKQSGDRPGFQKAFGTNKSGFAGIDELFYNNSLNDDTTVTIEARAVDFNYLFDLKIVKEDVGYLSAGFKQYRTWYDGSGGFYRPKGIPIVYYDEDMHLDRGNLWLEIGRTLSENSSFIVRYDVLTREGKKDSLSMGEVAFAASTTNLAGNRGVLPAFRLIDEKRHILKATATTGNETSKYKLSGSLDKGEMNNSLNVRRRFEEPASSGTRNRVPDRVFTHKDQSEFDILSIYASAQNRINEKLTLNAAVSRTTLDNVLDGSRIVGNAPIYDPVFDAAFSNRQQRDEGFFHLHGSVESTQSVGTINLVYRPNKNWAVIPTLRVEKITTKGENEYEEVNNPPSATNPLDLLIQEEIAVHTGKEQKNVTENIDVRYTGFKNASVNFRAEWEQTEGDIDEKQIVEPGLLNTIRIERAGDFSVDAQKYSVTANWYPVAGTTVAAQYYYRGREHDYGVRADNTSNQLTSSNRYPGYPSNMDMETNDMNFRISWRATSKLRLVTRFDLQQTTVRLQGEGLSLDQASKSESRILSETITWNPSLRWYLQANINLVWDSLKTPLADYTGNAAGVVSNSDNDYTNVSLSSGYAIDDQSNLFIEGSVYNARNYQDTDYRSVSYGTDAKTQQISATYTRRLDARTMLTLKYAYANHDEPSFGGYADYQAHMVYGKVQYRF